MASEPDNQLGEYVLLRVDEIHSDPDFNCRGHIAPMDVIELSQDIDERGLTQPIVVVPCEEGKDHNYKIVCGHRRHMAHVVLQKKTIPAIIRHGLSRNQALILNIGENIHRKDLNLLQEAKAIERLKMEGFSPKDVAIQLGKSTTWVYVRFELLELPPEIQEAAAAGHIKQTQIRDLAKIHGREGQLEAAKKIKMARAVGDRNPIILKKKKKLFAKKVRSTTEILKMIEHIDGVIGMNFGTRSLAWAAGEIAENDLYRDLKELANNAGIEYLIPEEHQVNLSNG